MTYPHEGPAGPGGARFAEGQRSVAEMMADFAARDRRLRRAARGAGLSRREFLAAMAAACSAGSVTASAAARALGAAPAAPTETPGPTPAAPPAAVPAEAPPPLKKSRVVVVTHPEVIIKGYTVNPPIIRQMMDRAVGELTGKRTEAEAWKAVAHEGDFVAIKYNTMHGPTLHSHTEINDAITARLTEMGRVDSTRVLAVDRVLPEPYDELSDPFTLPSRGLETRLRRLYTDHATAIINVSVLKTHFGEGISAALKNHLGSVNNPAAYHGWEVGRMPRSLPELNALEPIRSKTRLVVIDAIRPLFAGGPVDVPRYRWDYRGLIVATDPVAATAVGLRILEQRRAEVRGQPWPMTPARAMVAWGQKIGLGAADADRLDLVEVAMG